MFARASSLTAAAPKRFVRNMGGGGHGHGGPAKTLPPRPAQPKSDKFSDRLAWQLWDKRHPDYEGVEAYARYFFPHNYHFSYLILGSYSAIAYYFVAKGNAEKAVEVRNQAKPSVPDYHTVQVRNALPDFGTDEWAAFVDEKPDNMEKWIMGDNGSGAAPAHH